MNWLMIAGLVWLGCAATFVLALCAAAHRTAPTLDAAETGNDLAGADVIDLQHEGVREAA